MPKLPAAFVRSVTEAGKYGNQHGLILRVQPSGSKQWIWRGTIGGKRRDLGLGGYPYVTLAEARGKAFEYHKIAREGNDPTRLHSGGVPTFSAAAADAVIALHAGKWKPGGKSEGEWRSSLATLCCAGDRHQGGGRGHHRGCHGLFGADLDYQSGDSEAGTSVGSARS